MYTPGVPMQAYLDEAARKYDDLSLDLHIAMFHAHAQVYRARGLPVTARVCDDYWQGLAEVRRARASLGEAVDDAMCLSRPLTAEELADEPDEGDG